MSDPNATADRPRRRLGRPAKADGGEDTRDLILDAAEKLFAGAGFHGVSVRQVTEAAGVDVALAHYYFGTKRGLFDAVFLRRAEILNRERMISLDRYEATTAPACMTVQGVITAFLEPMMEIWAGGGPGWDHYFALIAQVNNTPEWGGETMARYFDPLIQRLIATLRRVLPSASDADLYWSYQFLSGALTLAFAQTGRIDRLSHGLCRSTDVAAVRARLPQFIAAGFRHLCSQTAAE
jgi:AcrR family transcriptional regulator